MALTYKTEHIVEKIDAPIICVVDGVETAYESGAAMYAHGAVIVEDAVEFLGATYKGI